MKDQHDETATIIAQADRTVMKQVINEEVMRKLNAEYERNVADINAIIKQIEEIKQALKRNEIEIEKTSTTIDRRKETKTRRSLESG